MMRGLLFLYLIGGICLPANARDSGQWDGIDAAVRQWYRNLMQPDFPTTSCCGEADAYWADSFKVTSTGEYIAIITDTRDDAPLRRPHVEPGTEIVVPNHKLKWDDGNPTGHGVIFLGSRQGGEDGPYHVWCYVTPGGV